MTAEENEQMTTLIKVPSLKRRYSDRRSTMLESKKTQQLPLISSIPNLRDPFNVSPTQNPNKSLHQISSEEDLMLINDSPEPTVLGLENSMPETESSLRPSLTSDVNIQRSDVGFLESQSNDFNPSDVTNSCETSTSELETNEMKTQKAKGSPDDCQSFLCSDVSPEGSETAPQRELKLLEQMTVEGNEQMTTLIKVPSLRRRYSDRRSTMLEPKKTQQLPLISSIPNLRDPVNVSPTQTPKKILHQISSEEDLMLTNDSPEPTVLSLENSMPETESSLRPSLTSDVNIQRSDVGFLESHSSDFNPSDVTNSCETSTSELETNEMKTQRAKGSPDDCQNFVCSDLSPEGSETAPQISANLYNMAGFLEKRDQVVSRRKEVNPQTRAWNTFYVQLLRHKLDFYNDEKEVIQKIPPNLSLSIAGARCERLTSYPRKKYAFSLRTSDRAEYYLAASSQTLMEDWMYALWNNLDHNSNQKEVSINETVVKPQIKPRISTAPTHKQDSKSFLLRKTPSFKANREKRLTGSSDKSETLNQHYIALNSEDSGSRTEPMVNTTKCEDNLDAAESTTIETGLKKQKGIFKYLFMKK